MKHTYITRSIGIFGLFCMTMFLACKKDFLDKLPQDKIAPEVFFNTASDIKIYVNAMYETRTPFYIFNVNGDNAGLDLGSDILISGTTVTASLNQVSATGVAGIESGGWSTGYSRIRQDNYLFKYALGKVEKTPAADHFLGEGYFFRAFDYFSMLKQYGDLPIITDLVTEKDVANLYKPRQSRNEVAKQIIKDLDSAIKKLYWKGQGEAVAGRINKEAAIVFKSRVALYEGTWEYYHGLRSTPFAVPGKDGKEFLELIEPAMLQLITYQGARIFKSGAEPYNRLFAQNDMSAVDGVFWYRAYDGTKLPQSNNFYLKTNDGGPSITDHLVDLYLNKDGSPQSLTTPYSQLNTLSVQLDPRFRQTIWTPDRGPYGKIPGRELASPNLRYPIVAPILSAAAGFNSTGYRTYKGIVLNSAEQFKGETDDIFIRYEEGLLALAEAKAILGTIGQMDIDKTINVIRGRVGMAPMNLSAVQAIPSSVYREDLGFTSGAPNIVNEVRRERTIEFALEGYRLDDIKRWAVFDKVVNGYIPKGAQLQEFLDYFNTPGALTADGFDISGVSFPLLKVSGTAVNVNAFIGSGRINPYFKSPQFQTAASVGFYINPGRDYLTFVPLSQIQIYQAQANVKLTQNPGWN
ncbi:RagB/SusD family nutrient uptake outer membrane protein [Pedobacter nutrimenti]|uniref:RagB/SusD family nutrient uptake outer membrane protein n=1 Tax=Pedobacter nutrimenti TaxID=1241337 RepID=UPI00292E5311|nr:RagB/SusD family nutrient uptake outer membrane protein [Pedobacter nutrimenti]